MNSLQSVNLCKSFSVNDEKIEVLDNINISISPGDHIAISGASGSGKSTLLHLLAALDKPTSGTILIGDKDIVNMTCLLYTSPSPRDVEESRMPSSA